MLPERCKLPLHHKCCLIHLGPVHLTLDESVCQGIGLMFQMVNFLPQQTVLIFQPLENVRTVKHVTLAEFYSLEFQFHPPSLLFSW